MGVYAFQMFPAIQIYDFINSLDKTVIVAIESFTILQYLKLMFGRQTQSNLKILAQPIIYLCFILGFKSI